MLFYPVCTEKPETIGCKTQKAKLILAKPNFLVVVRPPGFYITGDRQQMYDKIIEKRYCTAHKPYSFTTKASFLFTTLPGTKQI